jgi:tetratricopeptide (TPR) repeat protein
MALEKAHRAVQAGNLLLAEVLCKRVLDENRSDLEAIRLMGIMGYMRGDFEASARHLKRCIALQPRNPVFYFDLARSRTNQGRFDEAVTLYDKALRLNPAYHQALASKVDVLERAGKRDAARAILEPYITRGDETEGMAVVHMRLLEQDGRIDEAIALARRHLDRNGIDPASRLMLLRQLGRLLDRVGDYKGAFDTFTLANNTETHTFDPAEYTAITDRMIETFSAENLRRVPRASIKSEVPVFIACMPRSGSTLIEQIIYAHPRAFGVGELDTVNRTILHLQEHIGSFQRYPACIADLTVDHLDRLAGIYLDEVRRISRGAVRVANKHLLNYRHLGMISLLFPAARVIHIRRDTLDNCMGVYMAALSQRQFPWISDLRHMGLAWRQYERLMDHWREVLDLPLLEVSYEALVDDPDAWIRRIIDFCGLPWDDRCLRYWEARRNVLTLSYDQVNKPIFKTAVKRWENYEPFLGPLKEGLAG